MERIFRVSTSRGVGLIVFIKGQPTQYLIPSWWTA